MTSSLFYEHVDAGSIEFGFYEVYKYKSAYLPLNGKVW